MNREGHTPIPLVVRLARELADAGVVYCHWKSNEALHLSETGENDLDLLVGRRHVRSFVEVLSRCGFSRVERRGTPRVPGMDHYFGYDSEADRFVHIHAHFQLVLGHDRTKNYRLPIEEAYLASRSIGSVLPVHSAEFEYLVFLIRMVLKYAIADEIAWNAVRRANGGPSKSEKRELAQLRGLIDSARVSAIIKEHLSFLGSDILEQAARVVHGEVSRRQGLSVARRLQARLQPHNRYGPRVDSYMRVVRRFLVTGRKLAGSRPGYRLAAGGSIIAIIGGDGAGKSTAIEEITRWLAQHFQVRTVHLGKPERSWTTRVVRGGLRVMAALEGVIGRRKRPGWGDGAPSGPEYRRMLWYVCKARDRYLDFRKVRRSANRGEIVICDRYPHSSLRLMEVPQIERLTAGGTQTRLISRLIDIEDRYHRPLVLPDFLAVLKLDPEEAVRRKVEERPEFVFARSAEVWNAEWDERQVHVIDASKGKDEVVAELKRLIWSSLG